uniref:Uncharacterized protein n=1 Tax=Vitis vinifera TaxID=29760 RepID=A5BW75_VITVI|nr:hypothetical protein VITISV_007704 [Vitis vinifera]
MGSVARLEIPKDAAAYCFGIFERAMRSDDTSNVILNVALQAGSSQHGKHRLASAGSNCVTAIFLFSPLCSKSSFKPNSQNSHLEWKNLGELQHQNLIFFHDFDLGRLKNLGGGLAFEGDGVVSNGEVGRIEDDEVGGVDDVEVDLNGTGEFAGDKVRFEMNIVSFRDSEFRESGCLWTAP